MCKGEISPLVASLWGRRGAGTLQVLRAGKERLFWSHAIPQDRFHWEQTPGFAQRVRDTARLWGSERSNLHLHGAAGCSPATTSIEEIVWGWALCLLFTAAPWNRESPLISGKRWQLLPDKGSSLSGVWVWSALDQWDGWSLWRVVPPSQRGTFPLPRWELNPHFYDPAII